MSKGELESVLRSVPPEELIDTESRAYKDGGLAYMSFNAMTKLLENPMLFKTPVVRDGKRATAGYVPDVWKTWLSKT